MVVAMKLNIPERVSDVPMLVQGAGGVVVKVHLNLSEK